MSQPVTITVTDSATPALQAKLASLTPARAAAKAGPAVQRLVEEHLAGLGGNAKGWPSTRFYEKFARHVRWLPTPTGFEVAILPAVVNGRTVGLAQRRFGGTINPVVAKALAIPISPVSYGRVPSDFPGLFLLKTPKGAYLVQSGEAISVKTGNTIRATKLGGHAGRRQRASLNFLFKLVASVTQDADPDVLPTDADITNKALEALLK